MTAAELNREVLDHVHAGRVFYDYYDRHYVAQHSSRAGDITDVSDAIRALEDAGLIEPGGATGGDMQPAELNGKDNL